MRLSKTDKQTILETIRQSDPDAQIRLFGSRTDDQRKGGDIDLLIISKKLKYRDKLILRYRLKEKLGDRKIDLVITPKPGTAFEKHAMNTSLKL